MAALFSAQERDARVVGHMFMNCFGWQPHCVLRGDSIRLFYEPFHPEESRAERKNSRLDKARAGEVGLGE